ncbi:hypothetical protein BU24DRAFT_490615 [Aaosphaeria arxii CBS 175.79]|uniref:GmrSD restriction endonucleases N-terminal domain-containing protein n=1 Tax=Aaosphaeria arxii CBS 175.79 TaxID=1450172 RepID=A0A6A5XXT3_9PLEO|nr:uncharacterized protein BU24DRAFT_490615 [Aaosphaeria arxii CBS 175.79]KAF2017450.1 hypothetical protein BU24DRAFT_490615 [Aaosphaeria arxii CBS 175.79]
MPGLAMNLTPSQTLFKQEEVDDDDDKDFAIDFAVDESGERGDLPGEFDANAYRSRPQLSQPGVFMRSLAYLIDGLERGKIDIDPEYQREVVWTAERMTNLVNSLMENFYIPPIILNRKASGGDPNSVTLICVDGKQRLSSVRAFVKGLVPCQDYQGNKWFFCEHPEGRSRKVLSETQQKEFLAKEFCSFEYKDLSSEQEEDLFARVQLGMQLTAAEKMRAQSGPWQELGKLFVQDFPTIFELLKDRSRAKDFQMALSCFSQILEVEHPTNANGIPILRTNYTALPKLLHNKAALDDRLKSHLANVFNTFKELIKNDPDVFTNIGRKLKGVQTFAPIELVAVTVLISMYSETRSNGLLLGDIRYLRNQLRENFVDLRMNRPVWRYIWDYIDNLEKYRGAINGTTIDRSVRVSRPLLQSATKPEPSFSPTMLQSGASVSEPQIPTANSPSTLRHDAPFNDTSHKSKRPRVGSGSAVDHQQDSVNSRTIFPAKSQTLVISGPKKPTPASHPAPIRPLLIPNSPMVPTPNAMEVHQQSYPWPDDFRAPTAPMVWSSEPIPSESLLSSFPSPYPNHSVQNTITPHAGGQMSNANVYSSPALQSSNIPSKPNAMQPSENRDLRRNVVKDTQPVKPAPPRPRKRPPPSWSLEPFEDGVIDLTSDTEIEEERQNLLSSFRRPSNTAEQGVIPLAHNSNSPTASTGPKRAIAPATFNPYKKGP